MANGNQSILNLNNPHKDENDEIYCKYSAIICSARLFKPTYTYFSSTNKSNHSEKAQEKTEAELDKESSIYPPIKDFPFEVKVVPVLDIDEEQTELTKNKLNYPKIGGGYNILVTNKINHEIQVLGPEIIFLPRIADKILAIEDFNGDGYLDIIAAAPAPMGSAYTSGTIYVYDPKFEKFSESKGIIQQGTIDTPLRGCISVQYPLSTRPDTEIITDFYCWKNSEWKPVNLKLKQPT